MAWWMWILLGFLLLVLELVTPGGFFLFFFGLGAITVGALGLRDLLGPSWLQWLAFSALSLLSLLLLRQPLLRRFRGSETKDDRDALIGETAFALEEIPVDSIGRAELRGSTWQVKNVGPMPLGVRQRCKVEQIDGLMLWVRGQ